jgi:hypothetical protein
MKKFTIFFIILLFICTFSVFSVQAVFDQVVGKVEIKIAGTWKKASVGTVIPEGATISTGFGSKAVISIQNNVLEVKQLTRLTLKELLEKEQTVSTDLYLSVGKIGANVKSSAGRQQTFRISSPVSTAAVRGTVFEYDGYTLTVEEGIVAFFNLLDQRRNVNQGDESSTDGYDQPSSESPGGLNQPQDFGTNDFWEGTVEEYGILSISWDL